MVENGALPYSLPKSRSFKEPSGRVVALVVWAGSAIADGWLLLAGRTGDAAAAGPWLAALSLLVYLTQWLPRDSTTSATGRKPPARPAERSGKIA